MLSTIGKENLQCFGSLEGMDNITWDTDTKFRFTKRHHYNHDTLCEVALSSRENARGGVNKFFTMKWVDVDGRAHRIKSGGNYSTQSLIDDIINTSRHILA